MTMPVPETASCLTCGYRLAGLPVSVCPECGRRFDPTDERSFDPNPERTRKRRRVRRIGLAVGGVIAMGLFMPRGFYRASITFTCPACGQTLTVKRCELASPRWLPFRYPGVAWGIGPTSPAGSSPCVRHGYQISLQAEFPIGRATATINASPNEIGIVNELPATPEGAKVLLKALSAPSNTGVSVRTDPVGSGF